MSTPNFYGFPNGIYNVTDLIPYFPPVTSYVVGPKGKAPYQTIQSAANAALAAGGGTVYIWPGTYVENITLGFGVHLQAYPGADGAIGVVTTGGNLPFVEVEGSLTIEVSDQTAVNFTTITGIYFNPPSGDVFTYNCSFNFFNTVDFNNCILQVNENNKHIFLNNGFATYNFNYSNLITGNGITGNLCGPLNGETLWNANFLGSFVQVNFTNPLTLSDDGLFLQWYADSCVWKCAIDVSGSPDANLNLTLRNCVIEWNSSPAQALINHGANAGRVEAYGCYYIGGTGGFSQSTDSTDDSQTIIMDTYFTTTLTLASTVKDHYFNCTFDTRDANAIVMSSSEDVIFSNCTINTSTNPAISGAGSGTLTLSDVSFLDNSSLAGTLTLNTTSPTISSQFRANGDAGGVDGFNSFTGVSSTTISSGDGTIKMSSANPGTNTAWIKIYIGTTAYWIPAWTTNAP